MVESLEKAKNAIRQELDAVLKVAAQQFHDDDKLSDDANQAICNVIEAVFIHGLKDAFFLKGSRFSKYPEPNFWPFVSKFTHRSIKNQIGELKQIKSEIGKARAWIRIVLNEGQLEHYISLLSKDVKQLENFYVKNAFLRDGERLEALMGYLKAMTKLPIKAPINSSFLNSWTPSPLILSGLINGKPQKVIYSSNFKKRNTSSNSLFNDEIVEDGINALEFLNDTTEIKTNKLLFDDDNSSIYSHNSMIEQGNNLPINIPTNFKPTYSPFLSSTPENRQIPLFNMPLEEESNEVHVNRRKTTRIRRISKDSGSDDSRRGSLTHIGLDILVPLSSSLPTNSGLLSTKEIEKVMSKEKSVPTFMNMEEMDELKREPELLSETFNLSKEDISTENHEVFKVFSSDLHSKPKNIFQEKSEDNTEFYGTSLHDELIEIGYNPNTTSTSSTLPGTSPSSGPGSSGNSLATKGWSISSRKESLNSSNVSSLDLSYSFDIAMKNLVKEKSDSTDDVGTLKEAFSIGEKIDETKTLLEPSLDGQITQHSEVNILKRNVEMKEENYEPIKDDKNEVIIIEKENLIEIDEYGITRDAKRWFTEIPIENGLDKQEYRCPSCRKSIGGPFGKFNLCSLDAKYYCDDCWKKGDQSIIPSRVILNWDCRKRQICKASKAFLKANSDRPLIRIDKINPDLYKHSKQMMKILKLREKFSLVAVYLLSCKHSVAEDLKKRIWPQDYYYNDIHLYSFSDLENVISGVLEKKINSLIKYSITHVESCNLCLQKGFICEFCSAKKIIYPFQVDVADRCHDCGAVYHIKCFKDAQCPKCIRKAKYASQRTSNLPLE